MSNAVVHVNGSHVAPPTLLGQGQARIPTGGKIRAGIKILTRKAEEHAKAREIYERGVAAGQSFEQIEKAICEAVPELKTPFVPKNVPWFTVRADDFPSSEIARQILEAFGEDRGDGVKRLYRFPVVFPSDQWQAVMPHELVAWGASERKFWSEYSLDGRTRWCKRYAPVPMDDSGKRAIRLFGGRKTITRVENGGRCDPEACREYQLRQCNLSGRFVFFVPGIKSINAFELHTHSFYAMNAAIQRFETIAFMRGGRISGFLDGQRTPFYITKKRVEVPRIDDDGRAVRVMQWIIDLEAPIDVTALLRANEDDASLLADAGAAVDALQDADNSGATATTSSAADASCVEVTPTDAPLTKAGATQAAVQSPDLQAVLSAAQNLGIDPQRFDAYATKRWGEGWKVNAGGRKRALAEIARFAASPQALAACIGAEMPIGEGHSS